MKNLRIIGFYLFFNTRWKIWRRCVLRMDLQAPDKFWNNSYRNIFKLDPRSFIIRVVIDKLPQSRNIRINPRIARQSAAIAPRHSADQNSVDRKTLPTISSTRIFSDFSSANHPFSHVSENFVGFWTILLVDNWDVCWFNYCRKSSSWLKENCI